MAKDYFVLSNFGVRYFMKDFTNSDTVPGSASASDEIESVLSCTLGTFTKENTKYRTLNGNGWESIAPLGNSSDDGEFQCIREGSGNPYVGTDGSTTYQRIKNWFMNATASAGIASPKCIIEVVPRGTNSYEGTCYYVVPNAWTPGTKDTETGQEYSFTVSPFGPQTPLNVSYDSATDTYSFTKATGVDIASVAITGSTTATIGTDETYTATVSPNTAPQTVNWSVISGTGAATITSEGVMTPVAAGTVTVKATSTSDSSKYATKTVTISA